MLSCPDGLVYSFGELPWKCDVKSQTVEPVLESSLNGHRVVRVSAGSFHCGAVTDKGIVHMWGENSHGQCGILGLDVVANPTPINIVDNETVPTEQVQIHDVACGAQHTLALSSKHEVWAWGFGCQLGLVTTVFPVWKPQKVEHLSGRYVVQIACGEFHSLALVHSVPRSESSQQSLEKCGHCKQPLYTMIDKDDHVIISDTHYCPLGVELSYSKQGKTSKQETPASTPNMVTTENDPQSCVAMSTDFCLSESALDKSYSNGTAGEKEVDHNDPATEIFPDGSESPQECRPRTTSSLYPDEQALKDYLKRISEQSQSEQFEGKKGSRPPSRQISLKDSHNVEENNKPTFPLLSPQTMTDDIKSTFLDDIPLIKLQGSVTGCVDDDSSEDILIPSDPLNCNNCEEVFEENSLTDKNHCPHEPLEAKKSASLTDIRVEDMDGYSRRRSLPGLLSPGIL